MMHRDQARSQVRLQVRLQFCGFGGQGIVLSSVIFGTAAVLTAGLNAVQTQSYGSEARGGECQAELILAQEPIHSPLADVTATHRCLLLAQTARNPGCGRGSLHGCSVW